MEWRWATSGSDVVMSNRTEVEALTSEIGSVSTDARNEFGALTVEQLNWKPGADRWSVAQCFDHLITTNVAYFPVFDSIAKGQKQSRFLEQLPLFPSLWGKLLIKSLDPKTTRKLKAPTTFQPAASDLPGSIIDDFVKHQGRLAELIKATSDMAVDRIVMTSPAAKLITYSVMDAFRIVVVHEKRHFQQAKRVTEEGEFPR